MEGFLSGVVFYALAIVIIASAAFTAFASNIVHSAFSLLFTFFGLACLYIYLGADFVGISQVIIYVGGILVLLLFGVMFTRNMGRSLIKQTLQVKHGVVFLIFLFIGLLPVIYVTPWPILDDVSQKPIESTISAIGEMLLTKYLLPFEIASLLLLIALVGAMVLARTEPKTGEMDSSETDSLQGESE